MPTSKVRANIPIRTDELEFPAEGDMKPYVIFTQLKADGPFVYAGWVDAMDDEMAIHFGCEHYGQDQECVNLWAISRDAIAGTESEFPTSPDATRTPTFEIFSQPEAGDHRRSAGSIEAANSEAALEEAKRKLSETNPPHSIWVVAKDAIAATDKDDVIWRLTDQSYRFARGYSKDVRDKWEKIRAARDLNEYEKDDLKEMF